VRPLDVSEAAFHTARPFGLSASRIRFTLPVQEIAEKVGNQRSMDPTLPAGLFNHRAMDNISHPTVMYPCGDFKTVKLRLYCSRYDAGFGN